jgi:cobalamin biosynthesis protein CbiD
MEKTINIQDKANIQAEGKLNSRHCKPIICLETGEVFTSVTDAAEKFKCSAQNLSSHLTGKRSKTIKGKHFCYLSRATENLDTIVTRLREASSDAEDARKWRAYQAEQEAIRKAKEDHEAAVEKAKNKIEYRQKIYSRLEQRLKEAAIRVVEAEKEYEDLTGEIYIPENDAKEMKPNEISNQADIGAC